MSVPRLLARDRVLQACAVVYGLTLLLIVVTHLYPKGLIGDLHFIVDPVLFGMPVVALLWGRRRIDRPERRFWDLLALAWTCLVVVEIFFFFELSLPFLSADFTADALYILFYLILAVAVDLRPHLHARHSPRIALRRLESVAGLSAFFGVLIYFAIVVLPEPLGVSLRFVSRDQGYTPLLLVRLSLDVLLLGRFLYAALRTHGHWRRLYGLLAAAIVCFALKDARAVLVSVELLPTERFLIPYNFFLTLPTVFVVVATRFRLLDDTDAADERGETEIEDGDEVFRTSPLVVYAMIVPALHFSLYPLGLLEPASRAPREVFCLLFILVLGLMALFHQSLIAKDSRRASQELLKAEERLFRSQRLESVGRLAGGIAHDFNNYLTIIRGYCELVRERLRDPEARSEIGYVEDAADKATHLTRQLLAFGRRQVLRPEALDLNGVVLETCKLLKSLLGEDVVLELDLDPGVGHAQADLGQTEQVLMNLALNGRDAMPRGGTLSVRTRRVMLNDSEASQLDLEAGSYVSLAVADTGCGMTEDVRAQAFEPFFTTRGPGRGTGLGLSTVHGIMAQSGGAISLESELNVGTTVRVLFPIAAGPAHLESRAKPRPQPDSSEATLLIVEDNDLVRNLAVRTLSADGFRVVEFPDGRTALERFADYEPIDMLITDVMMAEMDGVQLADTLASRCPGLRVLFMSGYPMETLRERQAVLPPSIQLLEKPFTARTMISKVREVLAAVPSRPSRAPRLPRG